MGMSERLQTVDACSYAVTHTSGLVRVEVNALSTVDCFLLCQQARGVLFACFEPSDTLQIFQRCRCRACVRIGATSAQLCHSGFQDASQSRTSQSALDSTARVPSLPTLCTIVKTARSSTSTWKTSVSVLSRVRCPVPAVGRPGLGGADAHVQVREHASAASSEVLFAASNKIVELALPLDCSPPAQVLRAAGTACRSLRLAASERLVSNVQVRLLVQEACI
jgi:hypothetical protein